MPLGPDKLLAEVGDSLLSMSKGVLDSLPRRFEFGQAAMFFYLAHRLVLEVPATYFGLRGAGNLATSCIVSALLLVVLYPACRWYRAVKTAHPDSLLKYL